MHLISIFYLGKYYLISLLKAIFRVHLHNVLDA